MLRKKNKRKEKDELLIFGNKIDSFKLINESLESLSLTSNNLKNTAQRLKIIAGKIRPPVKPELSSPPKIIVPPPVKRDLSSPPKTLVPPPVKRDLSSRPKIISEQRKEKNELESSGRKVIIIDAEDLILILE